MDKLGLGDARQILAMLNGEEVASSKLSPRMTELLRQEGLLLMKSNGSRCKYRMADAMREACRTFLVQQFGLRCTLEEWLAESAAASSSIRQSRANLVEKTGDSKYVKVRTFQGFLVNSYTPIYATLSQQSLRVQPQEGTMLFIQQPESFEIPNDVIVVGMENAENFMQIRKQKYLFDSLYPDRQLLFVSRYPQNAMTDLREWLSRISNQYVHFGDFDLAGIHIYLSEFYAYLSGRASFLLPSDIRERLADGNTALYDQQYVKFKDMIVTDTRLQPLADWIHLYRKGYEQEGYIR